ncbi:MAG: hypothetical protein QM765_32130 [Myxococcales bacterium]
MFQTRHRVFAPLFCALLTACPPPPVETPDAGAPAGADAMPAGRDASPDCGWGLTALGECAPETPRGTPEADCPSGLYLEDAGFSGRGLCLPAKPQGTPEADCPSGQWSASEGFADRGICLPAAPALTDWTCPAGWTPSPLFTGDAGTPSGVPATSICTPPSPTACPDGERFSLASGTCVRVGNPCPAADEDWPDDAELRRRAPGFAGTLRFVKTGATATPDGSRLAPYPTLDAAIAAAIAGDVIALSAGDHAGAAVVSTGVAIVGACPSLAHLTGTANTLLSIRGSAAALVSDLGLANGLGLELRDRTAASTVRGVRILAATGAALKVTGGTGVATVSDLQVLGFGQSGQTASSAAVLVTGTSAVFSDVTVEEVPGASIRVAAKGKLDATDLAIRDLRARSLDGDARGLFTGDGAVVTLQRAAIVQGVGQAMQVAQSGALTASNLWISGMRSRSDGVLGNGLEVDAAGVANLTRAAVVDTREAALVCFDPSSRLTLTDVLVRDTLPAGDGSFGLGVWLDSSATFEATRLVIDRPTMSGLGIGKATVKMTDFVVRDCRPSADKTNGRGVSMEAGAQVEALARPGREGGRRGGDGHRQRRDDHALGERPRRPRRRQGPRRRAAGQRPGGGRERGDLRCARPRRARDHRRGSLLRDPGRRHPHQSRDPRHPAGLHRLLRPRRRRAVRRQGHPHPPARLHQPRRRHRRRRGGVLAHAL